ncbi:hypothetical protein QFZ28_003212 [Neobacillus niacini]|nr:hypothetical protein [Neobacillus niacini]
MYTMAWTIEERYPTYDSMTQVEQKKLEALVSDSIWRQKYTFNRNMDC